MPEFQLFATCPIAASVTRIEPSSTGLTRDATCITTVLPPATQWPAVPMYFETPSVKMKFIVQPCGAIMQPPAETAVSETPEVDAAGGEVPRQLSSTCCCSVSSTSTPSRPAASTRASSSGVYQLGRGCSSVGAPDSAAAAPASAPKATAAA